MKYTLIKNDGLNIPQLVVHKYDMTHIFTSSCAHFSVLAPKNLIIF